MRRSVRILLHPRGDRIVGYFSRRQDVAALVKDAVANAVADATNAVTLAGHMAQCEKDNRAEGRAVADAQREQHQVQADRGSERQNYADRVYCNRSARHPASRRVGKGSGVPLAFRALIGDHMAGLLAFDADQHIGAIAPLAISKGVRIFLPYYKLFSPADRDAIFAAGAAAGVEVGIIPIFETTAER